MSVNSVFKKSLLIMSMMLSLSAVGSSAPQPAVAEPVAPNSGVVKNGSIDNSIDNITIDQIPILTQQSQHSAAAKRITGIFTRSHYKNFEFNDELSQKIFDRYIDGLDYNKSVFLASDVKVLEKNRNEFDEALSTGNLAFAYEAFNLAMKRRYERYEYAISLLSKPMSFDSDDRYYFDREDAKWPVDVAELNEIWRQRVKFDALSLGLTGKEWPDIQKVLTKRYRYALKRITQSQSEDAFQTVMNSFARSIEAHTSYLSPRNADRFKQDMSLSLEGIGAVLQANEDFTVIRSLVAGGPAAKSEKLKPEDKIIGVAQDGEEFVDIIGWRLDDVVDLIKGPKDTKVRLQVLSSSDETASHPSVVTIVRDTIRLEDRAAKSEMLKPGPDGVDSSIGVITIPSFYNNLAEDVAKEINSLKKQQAKGIVVDLRGNGGGSLQEAILLSGLFIDKGPVVQIRDQKGRINTESDPASGTLYDGPLTVLVDRYSASASEIFAAAMQDYGRAVIIGEPTYGKGTVQQHRPLSRIYDLYENPLGSIQYTIAKFYRINGGSTQHRGVIPDIVFPSAIVPAEWGESQEKTALPWDSIKKANYSQIDNSSDYVGLLNGRYQSRVSKDPEFLYLHEDILEYQSNKDKKYTSLNMKERVAEREERKVKRLARTNERLARLHLKPIKDAEEVPEAIANLDPFLQETARITTDLILKDHIAKK